MMWQHRLTPRNVSPLILTWDQSSKKSMHRHIAQQNHILIAAHYFTASTEQTVYVSSVQGKGAEGCKELLEAFEACVKGATAASWGDMHLHVSIKYCYTRFIPNFIMFFNCGFSSLWNVSAVWCSTVYEAFPYIIVLWSDHVYIYLLSGWMHWFVDPDFVWFSSAIFNLGPSFLGPPVSLHFLTLHWTKPF